MSFLFTGPMCNLHNLIIIKGEVEIALKDIRLRLISELMKDSRRSDRDLAKAIGTSQPTVTRVRTMLEKEGYIREYTIIPDFRQVGYELVALTFANLKRGITPEELQIVRKKGREMEQKTAFQSVMILRGIGLGHELVLASFHEDYSSFMEFLRMIKQFPFVDTSSVESFMISLADEHYRYLTFSTLARHLLTLKKEKK